VRGAADFLDLRRSGTRCAGAARVLGPSLRSGRQRFALRGGRTRGRTLALRARTMTGRGGRFISAASPLKFSNRSVPPLGC
jgi:hypothetical protein